MALAVFSVLTHTKWAYQLVNMPFLPPYIYIHIHIYIHVFVCVCVCSCVCVLVCVCVCAGVCGCWCVCVSLQYGTVNLPKTTGKHLLTISDHIHLVVVRLISQRQQENF